jgi:hypothetical protein
MYFLFLCIYYGGCNNDFDKYYCTQQILVSELPDNCMYEYSSLSNDRNILCCVGHPKWNNINKTNK